VIWEATLITVTWEISSDSGELRGAGGASPAGGCNQGRDSITLHDTAGTETEDLAGSVMPSDTNLLSPLKADCSASSAVTFTWEQSAARCGRGCARARTPLPEKASRQ